ncbi:MAG: M13 family metallopeptidase [Chitinophagales bacterium]|nr:M13 family metallopeptidase [Chitinophagales bacterium]
MKTKYFILLPIILFTISCKQKKQVVQQPDVVAAHIDTTVNPADDFFAFANGKWIAENPIPAAYSSWSIWNLVEDEVQEQLKTISEDAAKNKHTAGSNEQKIGDFYISAMDTNAIEKIKLQPLQKEINKIKNIKNTTDLINTIIDLQNIGVGVAFNLGVYADMMNSNKNILYIWQGGLSLPNRDYYFNTDKRTLDIVSDFKTKHLPTMLSNDTMIKDTKASSLKIYQLEKILASNSKKLEELRDPYANYNPMTVDELNQLTPNINWTNIFKQLNINPDTIIVEQPQFFKALNNQITKTDLNTWKEYLYFNLLSTYAPYLNKSVKNEDFRFYSTVIRGKQEQLPRWKQAIDWEESVMGEILGQLYVRDNFSPELKQKYEDLCDKVFDAFANRIKNLDWMSDSTKQKALYKLSKVNKKVGYPDKWKNFSELKITKHSLVENIINSNIFWTNDNLSDLNKPVDKTKWEMTPQTYNAYYSSSNNEIVLPAAIFKFPGYKDDEIDDAVIYGYIAASTIGHEITHGFDDEGRQFDADGNLTEWWTENDANLFNQKAKVAVEQFNNYTVLDNIHLNGEATLGENIADLGGIVIGLDAFKKTKQYKEGKEIAGYTPLQRYFLGYAYGWMGHIKDEDLANRVYTDVHSPAKFRVNGPFSNVPEFYEAFNVQPNNKMYRPENLRVKIW